MAAVYPRLRGTPRPAYLPTAVQARLQGETLPSPVLSPQERARLEAKGIDTSQLDALMPPVEHPVIPLPADPIPARAPKVYNPSEQGGNPGG